MKNQLFRISPDMETTENILQLFGIKDIHDNHSFTRGNLIDLKTVQKMNELSENLYKYYIPCKSKKYLVDLNEKKCITILRQFLKCHGYTLFSKEKFIKSKKHTIYKIVTIDKEVSTPQKKEKVVVSFD